MAKGEASMIKVRNFDLMHTTTEEAPDKRPDSKSGQRGDNSQSSATCADQEDDTSALAGNVSMLKLCVGRLETLEREPLEFSLRQ